MVVALRFTSASGTPRALGNTLANGRAPGCDARRLRPSNVRSALTTRQPSRASSCTACATKRELDAPRHRASVSGKCWPISPRPAATQQCVRERACSSTSPSEWAITPRSHGMRTPPSATPSPGPKACTSKPLPTRKIHVLPLPCASTAAASAKVRWRCDLQVVRPPCHQLRRLACPFPPPAPHRWARGLPRVQPARPRATAANGTSAESARATVIHAAGYRLRAGRRPRA